MGKSFIAITMFNGVLFQQSLQDLVKGIRAHRRDEAVYIRERLTEVAAECRSSDMQKKSTAVLKLSYLQMMGYNISFANFHIVEVMSASDFSNKRTGYLAAAQSFSPTTDVLLLTTNQFKKDLTSGRIQECSQALTCLAKLVTESLASDLQHDVSLLLSSPRPYIRKKTLLVLYRLIMVHPDTLPAASSKFLDCLNDPDQGVVCAAVTVTCELARASPRNFLGLAPMLYELLTSSTNNWMLIKIVKLMGVLTPIEPRLGKKLVAPLTKIMRTTRAKSLLYECCSTVTTGLMDYPEAAELCGERLGEFMVDKDQNLKYLGLCSMRKLAKAHPHIAMQHRDLILDCLDDVDIGIRMRALELVSEFVTRRTFQDISRILLRKLCTANSATPALQTASDSYMSEKLSDLPLSDPIATAPRLFLDPETPYRDSLAEQLLIPGRYIRGEGYPLLSSAEDFAWYVATVLGGLARTHTLSRRMLQTVASQLVELVSRVEAVRPATLSVAVALLTISSAKLRSSCNFSPTSGISEASLFDNGLAGQSETLTSLSDIDRKECGSPLLPSLSANTLPNGAAVSDLDGSRLVAPVVQAAAWVVGEYAELLEDPESTMTVLLGYPTENLDGKAQVSLASAMVKVFAVCDVASIQKLHARLMNRLSSSVESELAEVHERSWFLKCIVENVGASTPHLLRALFDGKLLPVDPTVQETVLPPEGLDLTKSLLDTGQSDLRSFLSQTEEFGRSTASHENIARDDEDDLFRQLTEGGAHQFGSHNSQRARVEGPATGIKSQSKMDSPFYLVDSDDSNLSKHRKTKSVDRERDLLLDVENDIRYVSRPIKTEPVSVYSDDLGSGGKLTDRETEPRQKSAQRSANTSIDRFEAAFDGIFGSSRPNNVPNDAKSRRRRRKRDKRAGQDEESSADLIKIDEDTPGTSGVRMLSPSELSSLKAAPAHIGQQDDLLL